jgi:RiboL-PSP-HEPN
VITAMRQSIRTVFSNFTSSVKPVKQLMQKIRLDAAAAMRDSNIKAQQETVQCATMVVMSGYLEAFIRDLAKAFFDELKARGTGLQVLSVVDPDTNYSLVHFRNGAKVLANMAKGKDANLGDCELFIKRLHAPLEDATEPPAWEAFAMTEANPGPRVLRSFLKGLGINESLKGVSEAVNSRYSDVVFDTLLTSFIAVRNECAHSGKAKEVPTPTTVEDYVDVLRTLALGMCKVVDSRVSAL